MAIIAECPVCHRKQSLKKKVCACGADLDKEKENRKVRYHIVYRTNGKQKWRSVGSFKELDACSLEDARDAEARLRVAKRENKIEIFDPKPESKMTFGELSKWYLGLEKVKALSSYWRKQIALKKFNAVFGDMIVNHIRPVDLENYQVRSKAQGLSDKTIDDEIGEARTMVNKAFENDLMGGDPLRVFNKVKKLLKRNSNARDRVLSPDEFKAITGKSPKHLKDIISTGYYTGMRLGEILKLTWSKVDLKNRVIRLEAEDTKDNEPRDIPICDEILKVFEGIPRAIHDPHVFMYNRKPIKSVNKSLRTACKDAQILYGRKVKGGFVFHDLRHTFNTYMRKAGVPESVIMKITGHSTREMFDRYNTIDNEDTRQAVEKLGSFLQDVRQNVRYAPS